MPVPLLERKAGLAPASGAAHRRSHSGGAARVGRGGGAGRRCLPALSHVSTDYFRGVVFALSASDSSQSSSSTAYLAASCS